MTLRDPKYYLIETHMALNGGTLGGVGISGIVVLVLGRYLLFGYLDFGVLLLILYSCLVRPCAWTANLGSFPEHCPL